MTTFLIPISRLFARRDVATRCRTKLILPRREEKSPAVEGKVVRKMWVSGVTSRSLFTPGATAPRRGASHQPHRGDLIDVGQRFQSRGRRRQVWRPSCTRDGGKRRHFASFRNPAMLVRATSAEAQFPKVWTRCRRFKAGSGDGWLRSSMSGITSDNSVEILGGDAVPRAQEALDLAMAAVDRLDVRCALEPPLSSQGVDALVREAERCRGGPIAADGV